MDIRSAESPVGDIHERTIFHTRPFNFTFDGEFEAFSFYVPDDAVGTVHKLVRNAPAFKKWACTFVGRMDRTRCESVGMRVVPDTGGGEPQVEVRMKFRAPWWYTKAKQEIGEEYLRFVEESES